MKAHEQNSYAPNAFFFFLTWFVRNSGIAYLRVGGFQVRVFTLDFFHELQALLFFLRGLIYCHYCKCTKKNWEKNPPLNSPLDSHAWMLIRKSQTCCVLNRALDFGASSRIILLSGLIFY